MRAPRIGGLPRRGSSNSGQQCRLSLPRHHRHRHDHAAAAPAKPPQPRRGRHLAALTLLLGLMLMAAGGLALLPSPASTLLPSSTMEAAGVVADGDLPPGFMRRKDGGSRSGGVADDDDDDDDGKPIDISAGLDLVDSAGSKSGSGGSPGGDDAERLRQQREAAALVASGLRATLTAADIQASAAATAAAITATGAPAPAQHAANGSGAASLPPLAGANIHFVRLERPAPRPPGAAAAELAAPPPTAARGNSGGGGKDAGGGDSTLSQQQQQQHKQQQQEDDEDERVSVVVMNWKKPDNVRAILDALVEMPGVVGEALVLHLRRDTAFAVRPSPPRPVWTSTKAQHPASALAMTFLLVLSANMLKQNTEHTHSRRHLKPPTSTSTKTPSPPRPPPPLNKNEQYDHPRVTHLVDFEADAKFGLSSRFLGCLRARHGKVLLQDDDVLVSEAGLRALLAAKRAAPRAPLVGFFGRGWPAGGRPGYVMAEVPPGPHPIALTVALLASRAACRAFWDAAPAFDAFMRAHSRPFWNGEDITFSLAAYKAAGAMPLIVRPPPRGYRLLHSAASREGVHLANPTHAAFRDALVKLAVDVLELPA